MISKDNLSHHHHIISYHDHDHDQTLFPIRVQYTILHRERVSKPNKPSSLIRGEIPEKQTKVSTQTAELISLSDAQINYYYYFFLKKKEKKKTRSEENQFT